MEKSGFTLIELLISLTLVAFLGSLGLATYVQFNRRQILNNAVRGLVSDLRLAQSKAQSGERPPGSSCLGDLLDYQILISFSGNLTYSLVANCSGRQSIPIKAGPVLNSLIQKDSGFNWVKFKTLRRGAETYPEEENSLVLSLSGFGETRTITVGQAGEISF